MSTLILAYLFYCLIECPCVNLLNWSQGKIFFDVEHVKCKRMDNNCHQNIPSNNIELNPPTLTNTESFNIKELNNMSNTEIIIPNASSSNPQSAQSLTELPEFKIATKSNDIDSC